MIVSVGILCCEQQKNIEIKNWQSLWNNSYAWTVIISKTITNIIYNFEINNSRIRILKDKLSIFRFGLIPFKDVALKRPRVVEMSVASPLWTTYSTPENNPHTVYWTCYSKFKKGNVVFYEN